MLSAKWQPFGLILICWYFAINKPGLFALVSSGKTPCTPWAINYPLLYISQLVWLMGRSNKKSKLPSNSIYSIGLIYIVKTLDIIQRHHWKPIVVIMPTLSSLAKRMFSYHMHVVVMTTCGATRNDQVGTMMTLGVQLFGIIHNFGQQKTSQGAGF